MVPMDFQVGTFGAGYKDGMAESIVELALGRKKEKAIRQEAQIINDLELPVLKPPPLTPGYHSHIGQREPIMARDI